MNGSFSEERSMIVLDRTDHAILEALQRDSRQTVQQLAAAVGLTSTPCWKRVKAMEAAGVIRGYGAVVDRDSVGLALCVLAEVNLTQHNEGTVREFERAVAACPEIVACYSTTGRRRLQHQGPRARHPHLRALSSTRRRFACPASPTSARASC
jgi:DNA-binding Lrp family transcriptional regulator